MRRLLCAFAIRMHMQSGFLATDSAFPQITVYMYIRCFDSEKYNFYQLEIDIVFALFAPVKFFSVMSGLFLVEPKTGSSP